MTKVTRRISTLALLVGLIVAPGWAQGQEAAAPPKGQRIYSIGHSFHMFMPKILDQIAKSAGIVDHQQVGASGIGGSYVIQHWDVADDKFKSKAVLTSGELDVLTIGALYLPDEGIENFVRLASEKSPHIRVFGQEFWLPFDVNVNFRKEKAPPPDREVYDGKKLRAEHDAYFREIDEHVRMLNENTKANRRYSSPRPVRRCWRCANRSPPGRPRASRSRPTCSPTPSATRSRRCKVLVAYVYFAQIYGRSPVGLPVPASLNGTFNEETTTKVNRLLQEIAWKAVTEHPLSGVTGK